MRKWMLMLLLPLGVQGQNLIPNGDFELGPDTSSAGWAVRIDSVCSSSIPVAGPDLWNVVYATPDRLIESEVPCNWDTDTAASGKAYVVFGSGPGGGEAGTTSLATTINQDSTYRLSGYIARETFQGTVSQSAKIAFIFSPLDSIELPPVVSPQWQYFDTVFTASISSSTIVVRGTEFTALTAIKLDSLSLEKAVIPFTSKETKERLKLVIYPNPTTLTARIITNEEIRLLSVSNSIGELIPSLSAKPNSTTHDLNLRMLPLGVYLIRIHFRNGTVVARKLFKI